MSIKYILYNPLAGNGKGEEQAKKLTETYKNDELKYCNMTHITSYGAFFDSISPKSDIIICGGDGTLNRFINDSEGYPYENPLYFYATGSGNDFMRDLGKEPGCKPIPINEYVKGLPTVTVNGKSTLFINAIGYGIDGYCCEVGDELRKKSDKPINYTSIAIKGLLFHFKPANAVITVDGKEYSFKKVWLAPTMHGRFYGGGMMTAPAQMRNNPDGTLSVVVMHGSGKLKTLMVFPSIFKGEHISHTEMVEVITGKDITVRFDRPTALQIDGETIKNVTEYSVKAYDKAVIAKQNNISITEKEPETV